MTFNRRNIVSFFENINSNDLNTLSEILDENCELYFPKTQPLSSKKDVLRFFKILKFQYPELIFVVHEILIDGDFSAVYWTNTGRNRKNEHYENEGMTLLRIQNNKIVYLSDFFKNTENF